MSAPPYSRTHDFGRPTLTTGQVALLCDVAARTVTKWCDSGLLKGHRLPGSLDRRFERHDVVAFLRDAGMDVALGRLGRHGLPPAVLCGLCGPAAAAAGLALAGVWEVAEAPNLYAAGGAPAALLVLDAAALGAGPCLGLLGWLAGRAGAPRVLALCAEDDDPARWLDAGAAGALRHPFDPAALAALALAQAPRPRGRASGRGNGRGKAVPR